MTEIFAGDVMKEPDKPKRGPEPERLKLRGEWDSLVTKALGKKRPEEGWPGAKAGKKAKAKKR